VAIENTDVFVSWTFNTVFLANQNLVSCVLAINSIISLFDESLKPIIQPFLKLREHNFFFKF
jgi:hypothetical protein